MNVATAVAACWASKARTAGLGIAASIPSTAAISCLPVPNAAQRCPGGQKVHRKRNALAGWCTLAARNAQMAGL